MPQKQFGSRESTGRKLAVIEEYLSMYQRALHDKFTTIYIDAFAGSGEIDLGTDELPLLDGGETRDVILGSAERAARVNPPFSCYKFIDKRPVCIKALELRFAEFPTFDRMNFIAADANAAMKEICDGIDKRKQRAVVFLDPFGNHVDWKTVEMIARTGVMDLWYLFPAGLGVFRQIGADGTVDSTHEPAVTRIYGTDEWKQAFLKPREQGDMFDGPVQHDKVVTPESAADFMIERMKTVFAGGVLDERIPLGQHSYASYYLLFAFGNSSDKARKLARRLAKAALKSVDRRDGRLI